MSEFEAEVRIDISSSQLLVGRMAVDQHIESGGHPADLFDPSTELGLRSILVQSRDRLPQTFEPPEVDAWDKPKFIEYGRFLAKLTKPEPDENRKALNKTIIDRAAQIGLGPSSKKIARHSGGMADYYRALRIKDLHILDTNEKINDPRTREAMINYLKLVGKDTGKRPTEKILIQNHADKPSDPSLHIISRRFGSLANALELAGFAPAYSWAADDFIEWGVKFMKANNGWLPTSRDLDHFSKKGIGPALATTVLHFDGKMADFQRATLEKYEESLGEEESARNEILQRIGEGMDAGKIPEVLLEDTESESETIKKATKYMVVDELIPWCLEETKIRISSTGYSKKSFEQSIRRKNNHIKSGDIENAALYLGVFDFVFPPDESYLETLKVEIKPRRKRLTKVRVR